MNCIIKRYSTHGRITFDDYVACCVKLRSLTGTLFYKLLCLVYNFMLNIFMFFYLCMRYIPCSDAFRRRDQAQNGTASFQYEDVSKTVI